MALHDPNFTPAPDERETRLAELRAKLDLASQYADQCKPGMRTMMRNQVSYWRSRIQHASTGMLGRNGYAPGVDATLQSCKFQAALAADDAARERAA